MEFCNRMMTNAYSVIERQQSQPRMIDYVIVLYSVLERLSSENPYLPSNALFRCDEEEG